MENNGTRNSWLFLVVASAVIYGLAPLDFRQAIWHVLSVTGGHVVGAVLWLGDALLHLGVTLVKAL